MRESLRASVSALPGHDGWPKGSVILCTSCARPLYVLERGIAAGEPTSRATNDLQPMTPAVLQAIAENDRVEPGLRAYVASLSPLKRAEYCAAIPRPRNGDQMLCPFCHEVYVQVRVVTKNELLDQAYVIELVTLHPDGRIRVPNRTTWTAPTSGH